MRKLLVICGPTASGKTALSVECAKRLDGEIVSCDAFLIYRGLDIGTAKPTQRERQGVPHHMIDVVDAVENFSVSDFERLALPIVEDILARGKTPVLCGGTGFYLNAILFKHAYGSAPASEEIRKKYEALERSEGRETLHKRLEEVDPESAAVLHANDVKRVVRALEIYELTGEKKSAQNDGIIPRFPYEAFTLNFPREALYARIGARTKQMIESGLIEEVKGLLQMGVPENAQCMQGIGYKEVVEGLKNGSNESTMSDIIEKNTRNYAKRQITFFKKLPDLHWLEPKSSEECAQEVLRIYGDRREDQAGGEEPSRKVCGDRRDRPI